MQRLLDTRRLDASVISFGRLSDRGETLAYWLSRPVEERWEHIEFLRQMNYGYDPAFDRLEKVFEFAELKRG